MTQSEQFRRWSARTWTSNPMWAAASRWAASRWTREGSSSSSSSWVTKATLQFADSLTATWELEGSDGKTRLTSVQSGFDPTNPPYRVGPAGWPGSPSCGAITSCPVAPVLAPDRVAGVPEEMYSIDR